MLVLLAAAAAAAQTGERLTLAPAELPAPEQQADRFSAHLARAERAYQARDAALAFREYLEAVNRAEDQGRVPALAWLRLAQLALYELRDSALAVFYARRIEAGELPEAERGALQRLRRRLSFRELGPETIGLGDGNISALRVDGDDLWIGTWNGGVCRLSLSSGRARVFREGRDSLVPSTVRCIEASASRVWVGTYQGLFAYSKASGSWQEIEAFGGPEPQKVEALRLAAGRLYVGTLGQGLWRQQEEGWSRISSGPLPGDFVTCLESDGEDLLIGTLTQGVVLLDLGNLTLRGFEPPEGLPARNITVLLADPPGGFWIGSYGLGLFHWDRRTARLRHFTRAGGELGDDWVLCAARSTAGLYFGTLGGGLARYAEGSWRILGFREGIMSAEVPALSYAPPFLYLGSLGAGVTALAEEQP